MPLKRLTSLLGTSARALGFDRFSYISLPASSAFVRDLPALQISDLPIASMQRHRQARWLLGDPVVVLARRASAAFAWHAHEFGTELPEPPYHAMTGLQCGITAPAPGPDGSLSLLTFAASEAKPDLHETVPHVGAMLTVFCVSLASWLELYGWPAIEPTRIRLSMRERECLLWTAQGKTSWEIAKIIGRSEDTVNFHLKKALVRLNASNKCHAVAIALSQGQLRLPAAGVSATAETRKAVQVSPERGAVGQRQTARAILRKFSPRIPRTASSE